MAKDKTNYDKLSLGKKRPIKKAPTPIAAMDKIETYDRIVEKIHTTSTPEKVEIPDSIQKATKPVVITKRITLDIPKPLHKRIKNRVYDMEITMKQYFLELAEKDLINHNKGL